jgi:putative transposase
LGSRRRGRRVTKSDRQSAVKLIDEARLAGANTKAACELLGINKRTYERWRKNPDGDQRKGPNTEPANKLSKLERDKVLRMANSKEFMDKPPSQIVPILADRGNYIASESSFHRILKAQGMNTHRGKSKARTRKKPDELVATGPNQVYSWDITYLQTDVVGTFLYLYMVMDIYSRKVVGYAVHEEQSSEHAAAMIEAICRAEGIKRNQVYLHSDNGGPMKGATMLATLQRLGVMPSFSRPSVSNDNPYSEALFKTVKYCPLYPSKPFESVCEATSWVSRFVHWYNEEHLHSGIRFVTPGSRHRGEDIEIIANRKRVYEQARKRRPSRWSRETRNWDHIGEVSLNPLKGKSESCINKAA